MLWKLRPSDCSGRHRARFHCAYDRTKGPGGQRAEDEGHVGRQQGDPGLRGSQDLAEVRTSLARVPLREPLPRFLCQAQPSVVLGREGPRCSEKPQLDPQAV